MSVCSDDSFNSYGGGMPSQYSDWGFAPQLGESGFSPMRGGDAPSPSLRNAGSVSPLPKSHPLANQKNFRSSSPLTGDQSRGFTPHRNNRSPMIQVEGKSLPVLSQNTSSASRQCLLKQEFQGQFGINGRVSREYSKTLKSKKKRSLDISHAARLLEYDNLDRWLKKRNGVSSAAGKNGLTNQEFATFFKWYDSKMKRHCHEDGLNIEYLITDFMESGLFKKRAQAAHFFRSLDSDGNGSLSCEEFKAGLTSEANTHRLVHFKRFIKKIKNGGTLGPCSTALPQVMLTRPATTGSSMMKRLTIAD